jgi:hypothetical protein
VGHQLVGWTLTQFRSRPHGGGGPVRMPARQTARDHRSMSAVPDPLVIPASDPDTLDHAAVVALDGDGSIVGRATLSRLYGLRAEMRLELAPCATITLALVDALEREARKRRLVRLELDAAGLGEPVLAALRRWRPVADELRDSSST